ncbi:1-phosphatidylinositol 4,5-bisphosphate phosphodiesterase zeta-1, partial [Striga asiatica]
VSDNGSAFVTLFGDAASVYVGCEVYQYIQSINGGENESTYYRGLSLQSPTLFRFLTTVKNNKMEGNGKNLGNPIHVATFSNSHSTSKIDANKGKRLRKSSIKEDDDIFISSDDDDTTISIMRKKMYLKKKNQLPRRYHC